MWRDLHVRVHGSEHANFRVRPHDGKTREMLQNKKYEGGGQQFQGAGWGDTHGMIFRGGGEQFPGGFRGCRYRP